MDTENFDKGKGVLTIKLLSWNNFQAEVRKLQNYQYIWRGQKQDKSLKSSFDRCSSLDGNKRNIVLDKHLNNFRSKMQQSHPGVPLSKDDSVWALGQHYGLKTPLLDWTQSPYIAAYFAFEKTVDQNDQDDKYRYVYALKKRLKRLLKKSKQSRNRYVTIIDGKSLKHISPRFWAQKGIFTRSLNGDDIETNINRWKKKRPNEVILVKFKIPTQDRDKCLRELHLMNIDYENLLLDLRDVIDKCNNCC